MVNKASSTTSITNDTPDPSIVNQSYTVSVTVSGSYGTPTGTVDITEGSANCTATLSGGSGSCGLTSTTTGSKTLTATYSGDSTYNSSSGTTAHTVNVNPQSYKAYLPLIMRENATYFFEGPWELEPNNNYQQANGPLRSGRDYYGYPNDQKDYFSIILNSGGQIVIDLSNDTGQGVQLQLFYQIADVDHRVAFDRDAPYQIQYTGPAGTYYIYIYTAGNYNSSAAYTLHVTYP
jgi:hypothetical protein